MKRAIIIAIMLGATGLLAQEKSQPITIKNSDTNNGVVVLAAQLGQTSVELQCNRGALWCSVPPPGEYAMVRLPKNHGLYDCNNVDLYPKGTDPDGSEKIGQYCINER